MRKKFFILGLIISLFFTIPSYATVTTTYSKIIYNGTDSTEIYPFAYKVFATSDLLVQENNISTGNITNLTLATDYNVTLSTSVPSAGNVILNSNLTSDKQLIITRKLPLTQQATILQNQAPPASTLNEVFDRDRMIDQQFQEQLDRAVLQSPIQNTTITLPAPVTLMYLQWNASGILQNANATGPQGPTGPAGTNGTGDITGPGSSTADDIVTFTNTSGKYIKDSGVTYGTSANNVLRLNSTAKVPNANLYTGTGVNQVVVLDSAAKYPAADGSAITNVNATTLLGYTVGVAANNIVKMTAAAKYPAADGSLITGIVDTGFTSRARVYQSSGQNIANGATGVITFDTEQYDGDSEFNTATYRFVVTTSGYYFVSGQVRLTGAAASGPATISICVDNSAVSSATYYYSTGGTYRFSISDIVYVAAGSYIDLQVTNNIGAQITISNNQAFLSIHRIS